MNCMFSHQHVPGLRSVARASAPLVDERARRGVIVLRQAERRAGQRNTDGVGRRERSDMLRRWPQCDPPRLRRPQPAARHRAAQTRPRESSGRSPTAAQRPGSVATERGQTPRSRRIHRRRWGHAQCAGHAGEASASASRPPAASHRPRRATYAWGRSLYSAGMGMRFQERRHEVHGMRALQFGQRGRARLVRRARSARSPSWPRRWLCHAPASGRAGRGLHEDGSRQRGRGAQVGHRAHDAAARSHDLHVGRAADAHLEFRRAGPAQGRCVCGSTKPG